MIKPTIIMSIHYHKTGCALSNKLFLFFQEHLNDIFYYQRHLTIPKRQFKFDHNNNLIIPKPNLKAIKQYNLYKQAAPNFFFDVFQEIPVLDKICHFLREPYDWAISNFLYHTQIPTPEEWFLHINNNFNTWLKEKEIKYMIQELGLKYKHITKMINYLKIHYKCPKNKKYYDYLISLPQEEAIIFETIRFIINNNIKNGCDPLRSAINHQRLKDDPRVITFFMDDFRGSRVNQSVESLGKFLFPSHITQEINEKVTRSYLDDYHQQSQIKETSHITQNKISKKQKEKLKRVLRDTPGISDVLNFVASVFETEN